MSQQGYDNLPPGQDVPPAPPMTPEPKTSGLAIASLILGICGLITCGVTALVGLVLGIVGLVLIKNSQGRLQGDGLAIGGIIVSGLMIVIMPIATILVGMLLPALARVENEARKARCTSNLHQIGMAANRWLNKHGDMEKWPPSLKALVDDKIIMEPKVFICPNTTTKPVPGEFVTDYECIMDRADFPITKSMAGGAVPMAWDKPGNHDDGFGVVYFDGHVEFHRDDDTGSRRREFLAGVGAWIAENKPKE